MSDSFPLEALKAQAVAARTYALRRKAASASRDWDVTDTTSDQVFKGYNPEYQNVAEAVSATSGVVGTAPSGAYAECAEYYPSPSLLQAFRAEGVACTVGTDAHCKEHIARDIERAYDYMRAAGYTQLAVPTRGRGVRMVDL